MKLYNEPVPAANPDPRRSCIVLAIADLRQARDRLAHAGASRAADYVRRALKSAEGALRHAERAVRS